LQDPLGETAAEALLAPEDPLATPPVNSGARGKIALFSLLAVAAAAFVILDSMPLIRAKAAMHRLAKMKGEPWKKTKDNLRGSGLMFRSGHSRVGHPEDYHVYPLRPWPPLLHGAWDKVATWFGRPSKRNEWVSHLFHPSDHVPVMKITVSPAGIITDTKWETRDKWTW